MGSPAKSSTDSSLGTKIGPKTTRNQFPSRVYGVSASQEFWKVLEEFGKETGLTRSAAIVEICCRYFNNPALATKPAGRPRKVRVKA